MASIKTSTALILVDFINDIIDPKGKLAGKGYADFQARHSTLQRVQKLLDYARSNGFAVIHVRVGFSPDYKEQPEGSPLFGGAKKFGALKSGDWGTDFHPLASPTDSEAQMTKHRVSAFYGTSLDVVLRTYEAKAVFVIGCATDMAVQATVRDAHDRDYACTVIADCCIAANDEDHEQTLRMLSKVARVITSENLVAGKRHDVQS